MKIRRSETCLVQTSGMTRPNVFNFAMCLCKKWRFCGYREGFASTGYGSSVKRNCYGLKRAERSLLHISRKIARCLRMSVFWLIRKFKNILFISASLNFGWVASHESLFVLSHISSHSLLLSASSPAFYPIQIRSTPQMTSETLPSSHSIKDSSWVASMHIKNLSTVTVSWSHARWVRLPSTKIF